VDTSGTYPWAFSGLSSRAFWPFIVGGLASATTGPLMPNLVSCTPERSRCPLTVRHLSQNCNLVVTGAGNPLCQAFVAAFSWTEAVKVRIASFTWIRSWQEAYGAGAADLSRLARGFSRRSTPPARSMPPGMPPSVRSEALRMIAQARGRSHVPARPRACAAAFGATSSFNCAGAAQLTDVAYCQLGSGAISRQLGLSSLAGPTIDTANFTGCGFLNSKGLLDSSSQTCGGPEFWAYVNRFGNATLYVSQRLHARVRELTVITGERTH
jgi:hypothetical protein